MATTVEQVILDARALLDNYTDDGVAISDDDLADFIASGIRFADMGQKELYAVGRLQKSVEFSNYPVTNELGEDFDMEEFTGTDQYYPNESGLSDINSYYVEADRTHSVIVQEYEAGSWSDLITNSGVAADMTAYKGNITPTTAGNKIRLKMTGTTYYRHRNRALFEPTFYADSDVPDYNPWVEYTLPSDFRDIDMIVEEFPSKQYKKGSPYKFELPNRFYYNYSYDGMLKIIYKPVPTTLTAKTDTLEIDDITAKALAFYVASWISPYENQSMTNPLFQKYAELKFELSRPVPASEETIMDVYGGVQNAFI